MIDAVTKAALTIAASRTTKATVMPTAGRIGVTGIRIGTTATTMVLIGNVAHGTTTIAAIMIAMAMAGTEMKGAGMNGAMTAAITGVMTAEMITGETIATIGTTTGATTIAGIIAGATTAAMTGAGIAANIVTNTADPATIMRPTAITVIADSASDFILDPAFTIRIIG